MKTSKNLMSLFVLVGILVLTLSFAAAITETGTDEGTLHVGSGSAYTCQEQWTCSWTTCADYSQTYVCTDLNSCGTTDLIPANNGTTQSCGTTDGDGNGGGGSGGGGGVITTTSDNDTENSLNGRSSGSCIETWICEDWSNVDGQCGTRDCTDQNQCGTEYFKPLTDLECVSTTGISRFTGAVTGVTDKVFSTPGIYVPILFVVLVIAGGLIVLALGAGKKNKKGFAQP